MPIPAKEARGAQALTGLSVYPVPVIDKRPADQASPCQQVHRCSAAKRCVLILDLPLAGLAVGDDQIGLEPVYLIEIAALWPTAWLVS